MARKTYTIRQELVARFANALANPARVAICEFLGKQKTCYFGAIQDVLPLSKATVSQHLTVLKDAGLIQGEVLPPRVKYCIDKENWDLAQIVLSQYMEQCVTEVCGSEKEEDSCCCAEESECQCEKAEDECQCEKAEGDCQCEKAEGECQCGCKV